MQHVGLSQKVDRGTNLPGSPQKMGQGIALRPIPRTPDLGNAHWIMRFYFGSKSACERKSPRNGAFAHEITGNALLTSSPTSAHRPIRRICTRDRAEQGATLCSTCRPLTWTMRFHVDGEYARVDREGEPEYLTGRTVVAPKARSSLVYNGKPRLAYQLALATRSRAAPPRMPAAFVK